VLVLFHVRSAANAVGLSWLRASIRAELANFRLFGLIEFVFLVIILELLKKGAVDAV
jgi:hypothetical protein